MKKRGISAIVATILIILITVAAVTIIWVVIIPMITQSLDFQDPNMRFDIVTSRGYTFYDEATNLLYVQVKRGNDEAKIVGLQVVVTTAGNSETVSYGPEYVPSPNQAVTIKILVALRPDKISIAPVLASGDTAKVGSSTSHVSDVPTGTGNASATYTPFVSSTMGCTDVSQCDDGSVCTMDACSAGTCTHTTITSCSMTSDGCCPTGCNPTNDADCSGCVNDAACPTDTYECNGLNRMLNDNFCNTSVSTCQVIQTLANNCNDSNECTNDYCSAGGCSSVNVANGVSCWGGNGTCQSGVCTMGTLDLGVVAIWQFENVWTSSIGNYPLTTNGSAAINASGKYGSAGDFGPDYGSYAKTSGAVIPSGSNSFSYGGWVYSNAIGIGSDQYDVVFSQDDGSDSYNQVFMYVYNSTAEMVACYGNGVWIETLVNAGTWNHIFCVYNATHVALYFNGIVKATSIINDVSVNASFIIGESANNYGQVYQSDSRIDDVIVFNKPITAAQITKLYNEQYFVNAGAFYWS